MLNKQLPQRWIPGLIDTPNDLPNVEPVSSENTTITYLASDELEKVNIYNLQIDPRRYEVRVGGERVGLNPTGFRILHLLARSPGSVYRRREIVASIHGDRYPVTDRSIDVQVVNLRRKLGLAGDYIETVRGVGYRFRDSLNLAVGVQ